MMALSRSSRATKKFIKILNNLIEDGDFITFFYIAQAFEELSTKNIKFPDKLRESYNFRKYSLFSHSPKLSLLGLNELVKDNDREISEIATLIDRIEKGGKHVEIFGLYPLAIYVSKSVFFILVVKADSEFAYFEFKKPFKDVIETIGPFISALPLPATVDRQLSLAISLILSHFVVKDIYTERETR